MSVTEEVKEPVYLTGITTDKGEPAFNIPVSVSYQEVIRAFRVSDPAHANAFNKVIQKLIDNIFSVKQSVDCYSIVSDTEPEPGSCNLWLKPMGKANTPGIPSGIPSIKLYGVHIGSEPPDTSQGLLWVAPVDESEINNEPYEIIEGTMSVELTDAHLGDQPPTDGKTLWVKPVE